MIRSRLVPWKVLQTHRPRVLIFGASSTGQAQFDGIKRSHKVIGFVDNDNSKNGSRLSGKPVYSPQVINSLKFDKIIIASCYHQEIARQLTDEIKIDPDKISIFHTGTEATEQTRSYIRQFIDERCLRSILSARNPLVARTGFLLVKLLDNAYRSAVLRKIQWLDENPEQSLSILRPAGQAVIYGPRFSGKPRRTSTVEIPAIRLSRHENATIACTSNAVMYEDRLLMWKPPAADIRFSDYSSGNIMTHGRNYALTKNPDTCGIERGLAITGSNDVNYYHWMLEVLSKLAYIDQLGEEYDHYPILISEKALSIESVSSFIHHLGIDRKFIYLRSYQHYKVNDLLTITPPNFAAVNFKGKTRNDTTDFYFSTASLHFLRRTAIDYSAGLSNGTTYSERVFLARKGDLRPYNQEEVWEVLYQSGFKKLFLEDLSFAEQVHAMQHARYVVGPTGAAWTNLIFFRSGAKALCWMAEESGNFSSFSHIAEEMDVKMDYITYKTGFASCREITYRKYCVDVQQISHWLVSHGLT